MIINVLLIDDDLELSDMLSHYLSEEGFKTKHVHLGADGIKEALSEAYNMVLLDIMLSDINGIEVLKTIRQSSNIPIIMLTAKGDNIDRIVGLELGADDYISKPYCPREIVARIRSVLRRVDAPASTIDKMIKYEYNGLILDTSQRLCMWHDFPIELTSTEFNFLTILIKNQNRVISKDELSKQGLGRHREMYDRSVDVHISNIRQKLLDTAALLPENTPIIVIETIRAVGYRMR